MNDHGNNSGDGNNDVEGAVMTMMTGIQLMLLLLLVVKMKMARKVMTKNRTRKRNRYSRMFRTAKTMLVFIVSF